MIDTLYPAGLLILAGLSIAYVTFILSLCHASKRADIRIMCENCKNRSRHPKCSNPKQGCPDYEPRKS